MNIRIYHNPRCSKSRAALGLLRERGIEPEVIEYLRDPPDEAQLKDILARLGLSPRDIARTREAPWSELGLDGPDVDDDAIIAAMVRHPILIERPIVVSGDRAVVGRPPEKVLEVLR